MVVNNYTPNLKVFEKNIDSAQNEKKVTSNSETSFKDVLKDELQKVNDKQVQSDNATEGYINGEKDIHEVMVATEEARLSLELAIQVRNKLLNAYEEFNKMQV